MCRLALLLTGDCGGRYLLLGGPLWWLQRCLEPSVGYYGCAQRAPLTMADPFKISIRRRKKDRFGAKPKKKSKAFRFGAPLKKKSKDAKFGRASKKAARSWLKFPGGGKDGLKGLGKIEKIAKKEQREGFTLQV